MPFDDAVRSIQDELRCMGFSPSRSSNPHWYASIVISMLHRPGTRAAIEANATKIGQALGLTGPRAKGHHPDFHFGYKPPRDYFLRGAGRAQWVGTNHTFADIEPYCVTHRRSYRHCEAPGDPCGKACEYRMRILR